MSKFRKENIYSCLVKSSQKVQYEKNDFISINGDSLLMLMLINMMICVSDAKIFIIETI